MVGQIMGHQDIERLYPVYRACTDFCKLAELPFSFKEDTGSLDTMIEFIESDEKIEAVHPPISKNWEESKKNGNHLFNPDICDFEHKIIIEYEEETGPKRPGAKMAKKGHGHEGDYDTKRDANRNLYYHEAGFSVFRLWEYNYKNSNWKIQLFDFLIQCWRKMSGKSYVINC